MTKCTDSGCRNLQTTCADCGRTVCTKTFIPPINFYEACKQKGLIGCFDGTGVTSENYKEILYMENLSKEQIHNIIFNSIQALFIHIGDDFDKLVHLEDWVEKWIDEYVEEKFK